MQRFGYVRRLFTSRRCTGHARCQPGCWRQNSSVVLKVNNHHFALPNAAAVYSQSHSEVGSLSGKREPRTCGDLRSAGRGLLKRPLLSLPWCLAAPFLRKRSSVLNMAAMPYITRWMGACCFLSSDMHCPSAARFPIRLRKQSSAVRQLPPRTSSSSGSKKLNLPKLWFPFPILP